MSWISNICTKFIWQFSPKESNPPKRFKKIEYLDLMAYRLSYTKTYIFRDLKQDNAIRILEASSFKFFHMGPLNEVVKTSVQRPQLFYAEILFLLNYF